MNNDWVNPHKHFLEGVVGVVEATSDEKFFLWKEWHHDTDRLTWNAGGGGPMVTLGHLAEMPVCMSMLVDEVGGHRILFVECTSQVVDWRMVDEFLKKHLPQSAFTDAGYVNKVNAGNFWNVLPTRPEKMELCQTPPEGWSCSRGAGHKGPCAATKLKPVGMQSSFSSHSGSCNRQKGGSFCDCGFS